MDVCHACQTTVPAGARFCPDCGAPQRGEGDAPANRSLHQRVVITGMSAITSIGHTANETWEALKAGRSGAGRLTAIDADPWSCQIACEVKGFDPRQFMGRKKARRMDFASQLAVIAAGQALEDADLDLDQEERDRIGVLIGTAGASSVRETERAVRQLEARPGTRLSPIQVLRVWPNMPSYFVAETYQVRGHNETVCTACAAATQAIGDAAALIQQGEADVMIAGGTDGLVSETLFAGFIAMGALATSFNDAPARAMRPFDAEREGFIAGQGSGMLTLESLGHAQARGARIYAELLGYGVSSDAFHMIAPDPTGGGAALAMQRALASAGIATDSVDYINAHGTSTPAGDLAETKAVKVVFGERAYQIPMSSSKSMIGHMMGATGAIEAVACVMSICEGIIHPTINYETPDPACDLDYVPNEARRARVDVAMSNSFGLGGQNASLILGRYQG